MNPRTGMIHALRMAIVLPCAAALAGCISIGAEPPTSLLNLTSTASAPADAGVSVSSTSAIDVHTPEVPAQLDVTRVPVKVSETEIAYLQDAVWVEKPARLFRRLLGETLRTRTGVLVLDTDVSPLLAQVAVRGTLREFGYDAARSAVVVRFDAILSSDRGAQDSAYQRRRFEAVVTGITPDAASVGPALNRAANDVAGQIADWYVTMPPPAPAAAPVSEAAS